jgi:hypothetical protein
VGSVDGGVDGGVDAVKFDISSNSIKPEGTKLLAEALKDNQVMAELHLSNNKVTDDGRYVLLTSSPALSLRDNRLYAGMLVVPRSLQRASTTDLSGNEMGKEYENGMSGVIALAIPGMGGLFSANLLKNDIGVYQAMVLVSILKGHPALMSLSAATRAIDETELDMSGEGLGDI